MTYYYSFSQNKNSLRAKDILEEFKLPCVYCATSKTTKRSYVGKSVKGLNYRKSQHLKDINNQNCFHLALKRYGIEDFDWEIVFLIEDLTIKMKEVFELLNTKEKEFIEKYDSYIEGYNCSPGGEHRFKNQKKYEEFTLEEFIKAKRYYHNIYRRSLNTTSEMKQYKKERRKTIKWKEYRQSDKVKQYKKERHSTPEWKAAHKIRKAAREAKKKELNMIQNN